MSKLRQAAQQALEALTIATLGTVSGKWPKGEEAIKALRQALEAEQRSPTELPCAWCKKAAQQPLTEDGIKRAFSQAGLFEPGDELVEYEIDITRAIERAHGITGEKE